MSFMWGFPLVMIGMLMFVFAATALLKNNGEFAIIRAAAGGDH